MLKEENMAAMAAKKGQVRIQIDNVSLREGHTHSK